MGFLREWKENGAYRPYRYGFGICLMLFGMFAVMFPSYEHPIYGSIRLGPYHVYIGIVCAVAGAVYTSNLRQKK